MGPPLHIEVVKKEDSFKNFEYLKEKVNSYILNFTTLTPGATIKNCDLEANVPLFEHVQSITFCDEKYKTDIITRDTEFVYHIYKLNSVSAETLCENSSAVAVVWVLPAEKFHGLWENLIYGSTLKEDTLGFVETAFKLSDRGVDTNIIAGNRVVSLQGPPATGKSSLCRALAQKIAIRTSSRFLRARLIEINAHRLFSKYFPQRGKLVDDLFKRILEMVEDQRLLLCVLVDEVEWVANARRAALAGLEPTDSILTVTALLRQLERLKRHPNALVMTTSKVIGDIDLAFVDRADIKQYVGPPSLEAIYEILRHCCGVLMACGVVEPRVQLLPLREFKKSRSEPLLASLRLRQVARVADMRGFSPRAVRKLPILACALLADNSQKPSLLEFLKTLLKTTRIIDKQIFSKP